MVGQTRVDVLFAPHRKRDTNHGLNWIEKQLSRAHKSIDMALFVFTAQQLADALEQKVQAGLSVRLIADPSFASRSFSEVLDLLGVALPDRNCKLESKNQPFKKGLKSVGTPRLASGRQVTSQVRCNRQQKSDYWIIQLVTISRTYQRRNPAGDPLSPTRSTLQPRNGSPLGHRRAGDHTAPQTKNRSSADQVRGWAGEEMSQNRERQ
jgi:hypothetical protein